MSLNSSGYNVEDRLAIHELKYRCCWAIDTNNPDTLTDVFTLDGVLQAKRIAESDPHIRLSGHDALRDLVQPGETAGSQLLTQHRPYNPVIMIDGETATGKWYVSVISVSTSRDTIDFTVGTYDDVYRQIDGDWKIEATQAEYAEFGLDLLASHNDSPANQ